jgi:hypothetical protein
MITDNFSCAIHEKSYGKQRHNHAENYENYFYMIWFLFVSVLLNKKWFRKKMFSIK